MNIFFLSLIPVEIAEMSCDQHVVKIQLEICQMLYTAWYYAEEEEEPEDGGMDVEPDMEDEEVVEDEEFMSDGE